MEIVEGNLLNSKANHIAHCANCFHIMGAGIAKEIREVYPKAYKADLKTKRGDKNKLGTFSRAFIPNENKWIYNLYGQYDIGCRNGPALDYKAFEKCLESLKINLEQYTPDFILGFPWLIGCGLAGGNFKIVQPMIESIFKNVPYEVIWVRYQPNR